MSTVFSRGDVVRKLREARGWTQADLGDHAGVDKNTVNRVENDHPSVTLDSVFKVALALGVTVDYVNAQAAGVALTSPDTGGGHPHSTTERPPLTESMKTRLLHLVSAVDEVEAARLYQLVRQWLADVTPRPEGPSGTRNTPQKK